MAIKSLMFFFVMYDSSDSDLMKAVIEWYYRGITRHRPEQISFSQATLYFPLMIIAVLYLPSVIYVLIINSKKHMLLSERVMLFVFSIATNIFYAKSEPLKQQNAEETGKEVVHRPESAPAIDVGERKVVAKGRSNSVPAAWRPTNCPPDKADCQPTFSLLHSNILYGFFFLGASIILGLDTAIAGLRNGRYSNITNSVVLAFLVNTVLWLNMNYSRHKSKLEGKLR